MTTPDLPENPERTPSSSSKARKWPWAQIALLSFNVGLYLVILEEFPYFVGVDFSESGGALSAMLILAGLTIGVATRKYSQGTTDQEESVPYSVWMHRFNLGIFGATLSLVFLSLMIPAMHAGRQAADRERAKQAEAMDPGAWHAVRSAKGDFVVDVPSHWVEPANPEWKGNDMVRGDLANDLLFFLQSVPKEDITFDGLNAWADATVNNVKVSLTESEVIEKSMHERQRYSEIELRLDGANENTRVTFFMRFLETPTHYLWARAVATRSEFREHEETLRRIVRSVRME